MLQLDLSDEEQKILRSMLESDLSDLRMEISETDSREFKEMLKKRKELLEKILTVLQNYFKRATA